MLITLVAIDDTKMAADSQIHLSVYGLLNDVTFHMAKFCAEDLNQRCESLFPTPDINGMLEFDWNTFLDRKKQELRGEVWGFREKAMAFANGVLIGGPQEMLQWAEEDHGYSNFRPLQLYATLAEEAYKNYLNSKKHQYVYFDVTIGEHQCGRLVIELFSDLVPKTCQNFYDLCTGSQGDSLSTEYRLAYERSIFHRIVPNGWVQGGDIWMKKGNGGESIYGPVFEDENFIVSHTKRGIVGMANKGRHTNGSQFYITLQPCTWMDTKHVAFGQVIEGSKVLKEMEQLETMNERPLIPPVIAACGKCEYVF